jgi:hypothetical protein
VIKIGNLHLIKVVFPELDEAAKPGSPRFKWRIALIKEDFPTPDLPVTANFTGSFFPC